MTFFEMNDGSCTRYCYQLSRDPVLINHQKMTVLKLVLFDMDGVLTDTVSSWKYIHEYFGTTNDQSVNEYIRGAIDDLEFIRRDVSLWKENGQYITKEKLVNILSVIPLMNGAETLLSKLHHLKIKTAIVSAGLDVLAKRVADVLQIKHVYANGLKTDKNGRLTGEGIVTVRLMYKDRVVEQISKQLQVPLENIASVGNSCFDIPMLQKCGLGIAFNPLDECIEREADVVVKEKNLRSLIPVFEKYWRE